MFKVRRGIFFCGIQIYWLKKLLSSSSNRKSSKQLASSEIGLNPAGNCMFKVNNRNTRTRGEMFLKLTIKTPE